MRRVRHIVVERIGARRLDRERVSSITHAAALARAGAGDAARREVKLTEQAEHVSEPLRTDRCRGSSAPAATIAEPAVFHVASGTLP